MTACDSLCVCVLRWVLALVAVLTPSPAHHVCLWPLTPNTSAVYLLGQRRPSARQVISMAADRARVSIDKRVAGDEDVVVELQQQSTLIGLVLLALKTPATFLLPPWLFAYTFRTALNIVDLLVNKYKPKLPQLVDYAIKQVKQRWISIVQLAAAPGYRHEQTRLFCDDCVGMGLVQRMHYIAWHV